MKVAPVMPRKDMEFTHVSATATAACGGAASNHTGGQRSSSQESEAIWDVMEQEPAGGGSLHLIIDGAIRYQKQMHTSHFLT